jgi:hypothetical protein
MLLRLRKRLVGVATGVWAREVRETGSASRGMGGVGGG